MSVSNQIIQNLEKYLNNSHSYMSAYAKHHILNLDYNNIYLAGNSGTFDKLTFYKKLKRYLYSIQEFIIFRSIIFENIFINEYKKLCKIQKRLFNYDLIIHSIVLDILNKRKLLLNNICTIGDGKANFVSGLLFINKIQNYNKKKRGGCSQASLSNDGKNNEYIKKIYSINLPQSLIQDYLIIKKFNLIEDSRIKVLNNEEDLTDEKINFFLVPAENKFLLKNKKINLFVNSFSFQEMPISETLNYLEIIKSNNSYLYSLNREQKLMYDGTKINYYDFDISRKSNIIFEEEAKFTRYYYNLRFPFFHKKKGKVIHTLAKF